MNAQVFFRTYNKNPEAGRVLVFDVVVEAGAPLASILDAAHAVGMGKGGASSGAFEVQTDEGIWSASGARVLRPCNGVFKSWEQLEAEELADA